MPSLRTATLELDADGIAIIRMDLPDRPVNVTTPELTADLMQAFEHVAANPGIKGAILTSGKDKCFVAGGDIKDFVNAYDRGMTHAEAYALSDESSRFFRRIETCGKPVAAAINGLALGGGLELCLACHYRVIVDDRRAVVGQPEVTIGLLPGGGATQRLPRLIGIENALPLLLSGRHLRPDEALQLGLVHAVVPAAELIATARRWLLAHPHARQPWDTCDYVIPGASTWAAPSAESRFMDACAQLGAETRRNYPAPQAILSCVFEGAQVPIDIGLRIESKYFSSLLTGPVARNLMRTLFVNKGRLNKLAHRPHGIAATNIRRLCILGSGVGEGVLARTATEAGLEVVLGSASGAMDVTVDRSVPGDCDLVVELAQSGRSHEQPDATGTAAAAIVAEREQLVRIHPVSRAGKVSLIEIIADPASTQAAIARAFDLAGRLRITPIALHGAAGSYSERVVTAYIDEGMCLLEEGAAPALIEDAALMAGMAQGPLAAADEMPIAMHWDVIRRAVDDAEGTVTRSMPAYHVSKVMAQHFLGPGRPSGAGFYAYADGKKSLWPGLGNIFKCKPDQPDAEHIGRRLLYIQALEAVRCIEQGLLRHAAEADVGAVVGWGFPSYTGGPLSLIDTLGLARFVSECEQMAQRHGPRFQPSPWLAARAAGDQPFYGKAAAASL